MNIYIYGQLKLNYAFCSAHQVNWRDVLTRHEWPTRHDKTATRGWKHGERDATDKEGAESTTGGAYKVRLLFFYFLSYSNNPFSLSPQPPKTSCRAHFQEDPLSLATPTIHNPRKRAVVLVFGRYDLSLVTTTPRKWAVVLVFGRFAPWQPPTTPENELSCSFLGVWPLPGNHHHPPPSENEPSCLFSGGSPLPGNHYHPKPPKTSVSACFWEVDLFLVTTTTHHLSLATTTTYNSRKWARRLVFRRLTSSWQPPLPKTSPTARFWACFWCSPSPPSLKQWKRSVSSEFRCLITFLYLIPPYNPILSHPIPPLFPLFSLSPLSLPTPSLAYPSFPFPISFSLWFKFPS